MHINICMYVCICSFESSLKESDDARKRPRDSRKMEGATAGFCTQLLALTKSRPAVSRVLGKVPGSL